MGHHQESKSSLIPLIDRLNQFPIGLVDSEKLREILTLLFEEREAFVASRFPLQEATLSELAQRTEIPEPELLPILERMADKGLVIDMPYHGTVYYLLLPGLIGFFEFTFMKSRADLPLARLAQLMGEYMAESQAPEVFGSKTPLTRSLVYEEHVPVSSEITSYERAREIIKEAGFGAVGLCYCRHKKEHLGKTCTKGAPVEGLCISLGNASRFLTRRGFAREQTVDELLAILDKAKSFNLTHVTDNIRQHPSFICNCCSCCCELLAGVRMGFPHAVAKTGFTAVIDPAHCNGCGLCFTACNVEAITPSEEKPAERKRPHGNVSEEKCLGCGACIPVCKRGALTLVPVADREVPPLKRKELHARMLKEKNRIPRVIGDEKV